MVFWQEISSPALNSAYCPSQPAHRHNSCFASKAGLNCCAIPGLLLPGRYPLKMIDVQFTLWVKAAGTSPRWRSFHHIEGGCSGIDTVIALPGRVLWWLFLYTYSRAVLSIYGSSIRLIWPFHIVWNRNPIKITHTPTPHETTRKQSDESLLL